MVWPCDEKRRHKRYKASNNNEGGREETSRKAHTEVDGPSAERFETTSARPKADTEPRRMAKGNHGDPPRTWIRSAKARKGTQLYCTITTIIKWCVTPLVRNSEVVTTLSFPVYFKIK